MVANIGGRTIYALTGVETWYFAADWVAWLLISIYVFRIVNVYKRPDKVDRILAGLLIPMVVNNAYDEVFGDPLKFGWNEYVLQIIILICSVYKLSRWRK